MSYFANYLSWLWAILNLVLVISTLACLVSCGEGITIIRSNESWWFSKFSNSFVFFSSYFTNWWLTDIQTSTRSTSMHRPPYEGRYIAHFNNQAFWYILDLIIIPPEKNQIQCYVQKPYLVYDQERNPSTYYCKWLMLANNILRRIVFLMILAIEACYK